MVKRTYENAFERRFLKDVEEGGFYVQIDMFKVRKKLGLFVYDIDTTENDHFQYGKDVITKRSKSASAFDREQTCTKTELIDLFANITINDVWSAEYYTFDKGDDWQKELTATIQGLTFEKASEYIKKHFSLFGKIKRRIIGHKINHNSDNNYYVVRDLVVHFNLLDLGESVHDAQRQSIRNIDVNSIQYLIFNGIKYVLKTK